MSTCHACGAELSAPPRNIDAAGHGYCQSCWAARPAAEVIAALTSKPVAPLPPRARVAAAPPAAPPAPAAARPAAGTRVFPCSFCGKKVAEADILYYNGELACTLCYHKKAGDEVNPMRPCDECAALTSTQYMIRVDRKYFCADCGKEARIAQNRVMQSRRSSLALSGFTVRDRPKVSGRAAIIASIVGAAVVITVSIVLLFVFFRGIQTPPKPPTVTIVEANGTYTESTVDAAIERFRLEQDITLLKDGVKLPRDEAYKLIAK